MSENKALKPLSALLEESIACGGVLRNVWRYPQDYQMMGFSSRAVILVDSSFYDAALAEIEAIKQSNAVRYGVLEDSHNALKEKLAYLSKSAQDLREAQKAYLADRGNEELGAKVGVAAKALDSMLASVESVVRPHTTLMEQNAQLKKKIEELEDYKFRYESLCK